MTRRAGIYVVHHLNSPAFYIGGTANFWRRATYHRNDIARLCARSTGLGAFAAEIGASPEDFSFRLLLVCAPEDVVFFEDRALRKYFGTPGCLNRMTAGNVPGAATRAMMSERRRGKPSPMRGRKHTEETRARMSAAHKGVPHSAERNEKLRKALTGRVRTQAHSAAISAALTGKMKGPANPFWGKSPTPEHRAKISATLKARRAGKDA